MRRFVMLATGAILLVGSLLLPAAAQAAPGDPSITVSAFGGGGETGTGAFLQIRVTNTAGAPAHADVGTTATVPAGIRVIDAVPSGQCDGAAAADQLQVRSTTATTVTLQGSIGAGVTNCAFLVSVVGDLPGTYTLCGPTVFAQPVGLEPTAACATLTYVDTTPPAPPVIESPITGATEKASFTVEGTSEAGSTVRITAAGSTLCETVATPAGRFTCTVAGLSDGPLQMIPTATDPSGNSTPGAPVDVTVATSPAELAATGSPWVPTALGALAMLLAGAALTFAPRSSRRH